MTQTDYVKRGKPQNSGRKTTPRKTSANKKTSTNGRGRASKQNTPAPARPPFIAIGLLIITLGAFGYFLWSINGAGDNTPPIAKTTPAPHTVAATKPKVQQQQPDIPEPPQEQWQYMDELKKKEVEVETAELKQKGPYVMQCATFTTEHKAEEMKAKLAFLGFESRIKITQGDTKTFYRVQLGPYEKNRDAQADRHKLSRHKINGCKIWLWS